MIANGPVSSFTSIITNSFGYTGLNSLLFTMPAGFVSGIIELLAPLAAYKFPKRGLISSSSANMVQSWRRLCSGNSLDQLKGSSIRRLLPPLFWWCLRRYDGLGNC
jgi:hypothetical protein